MPGPPGSASHVPAASDFSSDQYNEEIVDNLNWALAQVPWGPLVTPVTTTSDTSATTSVTSTPLTGTFTQTAGRRIRTTIRGMAYSSVAGDVIRLTLCDGSNNIIRIFDQVAIVADFADYEEMSWDESPAAGSVTRKVRIVRQSGTGTVHFFADTDRPAQLSIEDIGAA